MLKQLKSLDTEGLQMDEALSLSVFAKQLRAEYEARQIPVPEWLDDSNRRLNTEITNRRRDALELRLKEIAREEEKLQTPAERREKLASDRKAIEQQLTGAGV